MHFTKRNNKLALFAALIVMLFTVLIATGIAVFAEPADDTDTYNLAINAENCKVYFTVNGGEEKLMENGVSYPVVRGATVKIRVEADRGYTIKGEGGLYKTSDYTGKQYIENRVENNTEYEIYPFNEEHIYYARAVGRTFDVLYKPSSYSTEGNETLDYVVGGEKDLQLTYKSGNTVLIPTPTKEGFIFQGWQIVNKDGTATGISLEKNVENNEFYDLLDTMLTDDMLATDAIYLRAVFTPITYEATRYDVVFDPNRGGFNYVGKELGMHAWREPIGVLLNGMDDSTPELKTYIGYRLYPIDLPLDPEYVPALDLSKWTKDVTNVPSNTDPNQVYRYYLPIRYTLEYNANGGLLASNQGEHVYNQYTPLQIPTRVGYQFTGWKVTTLIDHDGDGIADETKEMTIGYSTHNDVPGYYLDAENPNYAAVDQKIRLTAIWEPIRYTIDADANGGSLAPTMPNEHVFDTATPIPNPTRPGYQFNGWLLNGASDPVFLLNGELGAQQLPPDGEQAITLVATWTPLKYTVVFDGDAGADRVENIGASFEHVFDVNLGDRFTTVPTRPGYIFAGYYTVPNPYDYNDPNYQPKGVLYFDEHGYAIADQKWNAVDEDGDGKVALYAYWIPKTYQIEISYNKDQVEEIRINGVLYEDLPVDIKFRQQVTVTVKTKDGFKVIKWQTKEETHTTDFSKLYRHEEVGSLTLTVTTAPKLTPEFKVDYKNEVLVKADGTTLENGFYTVKDEDGNVWERIWIKDGKVIINNQDKSTIPNSYFGKELRIIMHGDGKNFADSDEIVVNISERPAFPADKHFEITPDADRLVIQLLPEDIGKYQFCISSDRTVPENAWQDSTEFTGLNPGTTYYIFVRIKHTDDSPHSQPMSQPLEKTTLYLGYVGDMKGELDALCRPDDGAFAKDVIDRAKAEIDALLEPLSPNFYEEVLEIIEKAREELPIARAKDDAVKRLNDVQATLLATKAYDLGGEREMNTVLGIATADISAATTGAQIQSIIDRAIAEMKEIKIVYITITDPSSDSGLHITSSVGISPNVKVDLLRLMSLDLFSDKVNAAIKAGKVIVNQKDMTVAAMLELLNTQEVSAAYKIIVSNLEQETNGTYEIRLLLPKDLRDVHSLRVAYYNDATGELEILETRTDGNYLIFVTNELTDFILIGDPNVSLTATMVALGVTLLLQLIAIGYLLMRRKKAQNNVRMSAFAPITMLTIRFLPVQGIAVVVILGALVIIAQIVLMCLLFSSDIVRRKTEADEESYTEAPISMEEAYAMQADAYYTPSNEDAVAETDAEYAPEDDDYNGTDAAVATATMLAMDPFAVYDEPDEPDETDAADEPEEETTLEAYDEEVVYEDEEVVYEDEEVVYEGEEVVYEDEEVVENEEDLPLVDWQEVEYTEENPEEVLYEESEAQEYTEEVVYEEVYEGEIPEEEGFEYDPETGEYVKYVEVEEEVPTEEEGTLFEYDEDNLPDIDDSYLADQNMGEELPDIDDSQEL